jgi:hypothetical protein
VGRCGSLCVCSIVVRVPGCQGWVCAVVGGGGHAEVSRRRPQHRKRSKLKINKIEAKKKKIKVKFSFFFTVGHRGGGDMYVPPFNVLDLVPFPIVKGHQGVQLGIGEYTSLVCLGHLTPFYNGSKVGVIVGHCGSLWVIVGHCGSLWVIVGHCGSLWVIVGHCGSLFCQWEYGWDLLLT